MGRPPKPVEQKRREGNAGGRPLPEPFAVIPGQLRAPSPPASLEPAGQSFWVDVWSVGMAWLSPELDGATVEWTARLYDEVTRYRDALAKGPLIKEPITSASGKVVGERFVPNPMEGMLRRAEKQLMANLVQLSIPPAARARLGLIQVKAANELQSMAARQTKAVELSYDDEVIDAEVVQ